MFVSPNELLYSDGRNSSILLEIRDYGIDNERGEPDWNGVVIAKEKEASFKPESIYGYVGTTREGRDVFAEKREGNTVLFDMKDPEMVMDLVLKGLVRIINGRYYSFDDEYYVLWSDSVNPPLSFVERYEPEPHRDEPKDHPRKVSWVFSKREEKYIRCIHKVVYGDLLVKDLISILDRYN